jgi:hypothetical protein
MPVAEIHQGIPLRRESQNKVEKRDRRYSNMQKESNINPGCSFYMRLGF